MRERVEPGSGDRVEGDLFQCAPVEGWFVWTEAIRSMTAGVLPRSLRLPVTRAANEHGKQCSEEAISQLLPIARNCNGRHIVW